MSSALTLRRVAAIRPTSGLPLDVVVMLAVIVGSVMLLQGGFALTQPSDAHPDAIAVALAVLTALPLLAWRRRPFAVLVACAAGSLAMAVAGAPIALPLAPAVAIYLLAAGRTAEAPWSAAMTATVVAALIAYLAATALTESTWPLSEAFHAGLLWAVAWFAGERTRLERVRIGERIEAARRERHVAAVEERARIARDLHDSVGHALNVIGVRAGAARLRDDPARTQETLASIEDIARRTVTEMDKLVGALRAGEAVNVEAPPSLDALDGLVNQHAAGGLDIRRRVSGTPRPLPATVEQAVFRILQEALTNASRHGTGTARVHLTFTDHDVVVVVANPVDATVPGKRTGHGVVGMTERARLVGGTLHIERSPDRHLLRARLPYDPAA
jgi:signal transduction histidine kinase